jgi:hypothetical protein
MLLQNRNLRALDRAFDRITSISGLSSPLAVVDAWFDRVDHDVKVACAPKPGSRYTVYELKPVTYEVEINERGDITHRRLSKEELEIDAANAKVEAEEGKGNA